LSINLKGIDQMDQNNNIDYRSICPPVYEQGGLNSCTANALACIFYFNLIKGNYSTVFDPSRLFIYYNTRALKNKVLSDEGGSLRDALKAIHSYGVCPEEMWPYDITSYTAKPPHHVYQYGENYDSIVYFRVPQLVSHLCQCLMDGCLFAFGISVYSNFETDIANNGGYISLPTDSDMYLGGHAVCAVGFDNIKRVFIIRNSWGLNWGNGGYFYLPYSYMTNPDLVFDIWTFRNKPERITHVTQMVDSSTSPIAWP